MDTNTPARVPVPDAIRRVFTESFKARDIAEPLSSFDSNASSRDVRTFMESKNFDVVGIRSEGRVGGFVRREMLNGDVCGTHSQPLDQATLLEDTAPLLRVVLELNRSPVVFIKLFESVVGIVTREDLQKAPMRMCLFGLVTLIEMRFTELIQQHCPGDAWTKYISETRLGKAKDLLIERRRRNQSQQLFDCLQLADKGTIVARDENVRKCTIFTSRRQAEVAIKMLERLRNNLAHSQDIVFSDWEAIVSLCEFVTHQFVPTT